MLYSMMLRLQQHENFHASIRHLCLKVVTKAHKTYIQCTVSSAVALQVYVTQYTQPSTLYSYHLPLDAAHVNKGRHNATENTETKQTEHQ